MAQLALQSMSTAILSPSLLHIPKEEWHNSAGGKLALNSAMQVQPCLPQGLHLEAEALGEALNARCCTDHWAVSSLLHPCKDKLACVLPALCPPTGPARLFWTGRGDNVKLHCRSPREKRERRIALPRLPSELRTLVLLLLSFLLLCSFLMCSNEQRHMNSLLGVDFEQPLGQEAATSHLTDCMMALLQFGPE